MIAEHCQCGIPARYEHECVRSDVPVPQHLVDARNANKKDRKQSAWPSFFQKWKVGDSVLVSWTALASMQQHAKWLNQKIFWVAVPGRTMDHMAAARVWRIE